mgnify:CR=1 FL=1
MGRAIIFVDAQNDFVKHFANRDCTQVFEGARGLMNVEFGDVPTYHFTSGHSNTPGRPFFGKGPGKWREHCTTHQRVTRYGWEAWLQDKSLNTSALEALLLSNDSRQRCIWDFMSDEVGFDEVILCGMGTELGIRTTALDARKKGLKTILAADLCVPYNLDHEHEGVDAVLDMEDAGVEVLTSSEIVHGRAQERKRQ